VKSAQGTVLRMRWLWLVAVALAVAACQPAPAASPGTQPPTTGPLPKPAAPAASPSPSAAPGASPGASPSAPTPSVVASPAAAGVSFDEQGVASFYRGKTVRFIITSAPGGTADTTARLVAQYLAKYIPGTPAIVPENRAGASGIIGTNAIYNTEPKDGTVIGASDSSLVNLQALGGDQVAYDAGKVNWLGAVTTDATGCLARSDTGVASLQDLISGGKRLVLGAGDKGNNIYDLPAVLNATLGTSIRIVPGYAGVAPIRLAVQSGEVDGFCITWKAMLVSDLPWLEGDNPYARVFVMLGSSLPPHPVFQNATLAEAVARTEADRQLMQMVDGPQRMNRPYFVAPEVPADRVAGLRRALAMTFADPEFLDAAARSRIDVSPLSGEQVLAVVQQVLGTPRPVVDRYKEILR
jgi:tripartite-type tricarboxylate transporter receptor subunit TctC